MSDNSQTLFAIDGARLKLAAHGPERLVALLALIEQAQERLDLFYYIMAADASGDQVLRALEAAALRGVKVRLMLDAFGSGSLEETHFAALRAAGGHMLWFGLRWSAQFLIRNHQKMAIADGRLALIGGFNVAQPYFADDATGWNDLGLLLEGGAVAALGHWYDQLWDWTSGRKRRFRRLRAMVRGWNPGNGRLRWLVGGPTYRLSPFARAMRQDLVQAKRVDMIMAYFTPGRNMLAALGGAASRAGTRLVLAAKSDNSTTIAAARMLYAGLMQKGVSLYEYQPRKLHMKLIVIDDVVYIGSANFDLRSLFLNLELMLRIEDPAFAAHMRDFVTQQIAQSAPITPAFLAEHSGLWCRLKGWISYALVAFVDFTVTRKLNFKAHKLPVDAP